MTKKHLQMKGRIFRWAQNITNDPKEMGKKSKACNKEGLILESMLIRWIQNLDFLNRFFLDKLTPFALFRHGSIVTS